VVWYSFSSSPSSFFSVAFFLWYLTSGCLMSLYDILLSFLSRYCHPFRSLLSAFSIVALGQVSRVVPVRFAPILPFCPHPMVLVRVIFFPSLHPQLAFPSGFFSAGYKMSCFGILLFFRHFILRTSFLRFFVSETCYLFVTGPPRWV